VQPAWPAWAQQPARLAGCCRCGVALGHVAGLLPDGLAAAETSRRFGVQRTEHQEGNQHQRKETFHGVSIPWK
jgi:hypothetical protein